MPLRFSKLLIGQVMQKSLMRGVILTIDLGHPDPVSPKTFDYSNP